MCINMKEMYLCSNPKHMYGNFLILTRQYNEYCQYNKEYVFFGNSHYIKRFQNVERCYVPCGKCVTCMTKRSKSWTLRLTTEYLKYDKNCVLTLTYDDEHLPENGLLNYRDVQLFIKRLRKRLCKKYGKDYRIRYACACEYGTQNTLRPHYHIIIFNWFPEDIDLRKPYKITKKNSQLYKSKICDDLWNNGFVDVGLVNHHTSRYVCQYCVKKAVFKTDERLIEKCKEKREKLVASVGTGLEYFMKNYKSMFANMFAVLGNYKYPIHKYFKNKLKDLFPELYEKYKLKCKEILRDFEYTSEYRKRAEALDFKYKQMYLLFHT